MSNILAVQDSNNDVGISTSSINLTSNNNFKFIDNNNHTYLQLNTVSNTIDLTTIKQSTWNGTPIDLSYGGTGLTQINGTSGQVLSIKSDLSGCTFSDLLTTRNTTDISHAAQNNITVGNINQPLNLNSSNKFKINSTPSNNQILGYNNNGITFINDNNINIANDLWTLVNMFYPGYKYLLMSLVVKKSNNNTNLIDFIPTKYNYTLTVINTSPVISIIPQVFNNSKIEFKHNVDNNNLNSFNNYSEISDNSQNNFTLTDSTNIISNYITSNFEFRIQDYNTQIYTLQILQKKITVIISAYTDSDYTQQFNSGNYHNNDLYIKIVFSEVVTGFSAANITKLNFDSNINPISNNGLMYKFLLSKPTVTSNTNCQFFVDQGVINDTEQNINQISNTFSFIFNNNNPYVNISAYLNSNFTNDNNGSFIINNSTLSRSNIVNNRIYIKLKANQSIYSFVSSNITITDANNVNISLNNYNSNGNYTEFTFNFIVTNSSDTYIISINNVLSTNFVINLI